MIPTIYIRTSPSVDMAVRAQQGILNKPTVLFIHGLGDSSLTWLPIIEDERLSEYTLLAPDLPGYGKTMVHEGHGGGIENHVQHLLAMIEETVGGPLFIVGHSMGGLAATLLLRQLETAQPEASSEKYHLPVEPLGFINVEGNLTEADAFISSRAVRRDDSGQFDTWWRRFVQTNKTGRWIQDNPQYGHYPESLDMCDPETFRRDCRSLVEWKNKLDNESGLNAAGAEFLRIGVPRIYVFGTESIPVETAHFIEEHNLDTYAIDGGGHWAMLDDREGFIKLLLRQLSEQDAD